MSVLLVMLGVAVLVVGVVVVARQPEPAQHKVPRPIPRLSPAELREYTRNLHPREFEIMLKLQMAAAEYGMPPDTSIDYAAEVVHAAYRSSGSARAHAQKVIAAALAKPADPMKRAMLNAMRISSATDEVASRRLEIATYGPPADKWFSFGAWQLSEPVLGIMREIESDLRSRGMAPEPASRYAMIFGYLMRPDAHPVERSMAGWMLADTRALAED